MGKGEKMKTLEKLIRESSYINEDEDTTGYGLTVYPDLRLSVQKVTDEGIHIIIHVDGRNSNTLDFIINDNELKELF